MRSAVIDSVTGAVLNIIVADPAVDASPDAGTYLLVIPDELGVDTSWTIVDGQFVAPERPPALPPDHPPLP